jgi:CHAT domain-containing protein
MERGELALLLALAAENERLDLFTQQAASLDLGLAQALHTLYLERRLSQPSYAMEAANALVQLADRVGDAEIRSLADWTAGMAALHVEGEAERSLQYLDRAAARFLALNQPYQAATVQISRLHALALLGRYEEAMASGLEAHGLFLQRSEALTIGKLEQNLGSIQWRRGRYHEAEQFFRAARQRYLPTNDQAQLAQVNNCLGNVLSLQYRFREAESCYQQALTYAEGAALAITQAEIECNWGSLALARGQYDQALDYLERSRRRYAVLDMAHESAIAEQELAEAYLELNLAPEASAIYAQVIPLFTTYGLRAEKARALLYAGRAHCLLGQFARAYEQLREAQTLYIEEGNAVGAAMSLVVQAHVSFTEGHFATVEAIAIQAEGPLIASGVWGWLLWARWLRGEAARLQGRQQDVHSLLMATLQEAQRWQLPSLIQCCYTSLGLLALRLDDREGAERAFQQAVELIETMRAPLPAEEFRTAFVADKLTPYTELVRLCLADGSPTRVAQAFRYVEQARSRALVELLAGALPAHPTPRDSFEAELLARLEILRADLNWFYSQISHPGGEAARSTAAIANLYDAVRTREATIQMITRQLQQCKQDSPSPSDGVWGDFDLAQLQQDLGDETVLVEYFSLDNLLLAFVVTGDALRVVQLPASETEVTQVLHQFQFQLGALRYGADRLRDRLPLLATRALTHSSTLYDLLLRPLEELLGERRLLVAPYRTLHYVPFPALYDGARYVIEQREVCYTPSASVLRHCLAAPRRPFQRALLLGVSDEAAPRIRDEVTTLATLFPETVTLLDEQATRTALFEQAPAANLLHLACHGRFRSDNPLFSSLRLADGWLTVRDTYGLQLDCDLVTLSACETGISQVAPGDELMGLVRGFFAAGAPTLLVSLWTVDDQATEQLMTCFYRALLDGASPAAALRTAQRQLLLLYPHPYFWSPFVLHGRW